MSHLDRRNGWSDNLRLQGRIHREAGNGKAIFEGKWRGGPFVPKQPLEKGRPDRGGSVESRHLPVDAEDGVVDVVSVRVLSDDTGGAEDIVSGTEDTVVTGVRGSTVGIVSARLGEVTAPT